MTVTHVSRAWRAFVSNLALLWAEDICAIYERGAIVEFLQRSRGAPLVIDINRLESAAHRRPFDVEILPLIIAGDKICYARILHSDFHQRSAELASAVSKTHFVHLTSLELFLPMASNLMTEFDAPLIEFLSLTSDAGSSDEAPILFSVLLSILRRCSRISTLRLGHAVQNPIDVSETPEPSPLPLTPLHELRVHSFNEALAVAILDQTVPGPDSVFDFILDEVKDISTAHSKLKRRSPDSECRLIVGHGFLNSLDGANVNHSTYFATRIHYGGTSMTYRLHWDRTSWKWPDLIRALGPDSITALSIRNTHPMEEHAPPIDADLPSLMSSLHHVANIDLSYITQVRALKYLPLECPLLSISIQCHDYELPHDILDWLTVRGKHARGLEITLEGESWPSGDPRFYDDEEGALLAEVRKLCRVRDNRRVITGDLA